MGPLNADIVLGLDISTKTGYAVGEFTRSRATIKEAGKITCPSEKGWDRCADMAVQLMSLLHNYQPGLVIVEGYAHSAKFAQQVTYEVGTVLRYFLWQGGYAEGWKDPGTLEEVYYDVSPTGLKKFVTGSGASKKDTMIKEVFKRWGFDTNDNDVADAVGLCYFGGAMLGRVEMPKVNMEALTAVLSPPPPKPKKKK